MRLFIALLVGLMLTPGASAQTLPPDFQESTVFSGLVYPTVVKFASDGRVFVAEKSGLIKVYASLTATTFTIVADLRPQVQDYWDRGLLGLELDPGFPARPYVYVLYALDKNPADPASLIPTWGDECPSPPDGMGAGCTILGRVSRLDASAPWPVQATEVVLIEDFPQQFPSHSVGGLRFGADGALYVSVGEGASFTVVDYGQLGGASGAGPGQNVPINPFGDPPVPTGGLQAVPGAQGGALRSQSVRRPAGQPVTLSGALLRIDPDTGDAMPDNPLFGSPDPKARRIVAYGLRNPFRFAMRPGSTEVWLGDVGWNDAEEINLVDVAGGSAANFGWPCYEGVGPQSAYQAAGLTSCLTLQLEGSARPPFFGYRHADQVVPGENCATGTSSVSGLAFYTYGNYPATYQGALFFTDWARRCIWAMRPDGTGTPNPALITTFASGMPGGAVNIETGPDGDLFYVDFDLGRIQRIRYFGGNQPPVAQVTATPATGPSPLLVQFNASGSYDPEGGALTFAWDLDADGAFDDSTLPNPTWTYTTSGQRQVRVRVSDPDTNTSIGNITVFTDNQPPAAVITTPTAAVNWTVGQTIAFSGVAADPEQGTLPPSAFHWTLRMQHCPAGCHTHVIRTWAGFAGGSFTAPDHEYPSWLELELRVTDLGGLEDTALVALMPRTVNVAFATTPPGLVLAVGAAADTTPFTRTLIVGSVNSVSAPASQVYSGETLGYRSWSDGGAATHTIVAPSTPTTLVAEYAVLANLTLTEAVAQSTVVQGGRLRVTATVANAGPAPATTVVLSKTVPPGTKLVSTSPTNMCALLGTVLTCSLPNLAPLASTQVELTLRISSAGSMSAVGTVASAQADPDLADNSATASATVTPPADLNGDGWPDVLWQNSVSGMTAAWWLQNTTVLAAVVLNPDRGPDPNWRLGGLGDFDGDGKVDLFWRNQGTGANEIWRMDGATRMALLPFPSVTDLAWEVVGVSDFSGDGWPDLLWRNGTVGSNWITLMEGATASGGAVLPTAASAVWQISGTPELNGDGKPDIAWRNTADGTNAAWLMDGVIVTSAPLLFNPLDLSWVPVGYADLNGDGRDDMILRNQIWGVNVAVYMNGLTPTGGQLLPTVSNMTWRMIGPR